MSVWDSIHRQPIPPGAVLHSYKVPCEFAADPAFQVEPPGRGRVPRLGMAAVSFGVERYVRPIHLEADGTVHERTDLNLIFAGYGVQVNCPDCMALLSEHVLKNDLDDGRPHSTRGIPGAY